MPLKQRSPKLVKPSGRLRLLRAWQADKAKGAMLFKEEGSVSLLSLESKARADSGNSEIPSGRAKLVKRFIWAKQDAPKVLRLEGKFKVLSLVQPKKA
jgi:hypothetical protein